jgi:hypothetical protein
VIFLLPPAAAVALVAAGKAGSGVLLRGHPVKAAFNVAQWSAAASVGAATFNLLRPPGPPTHRQIPALLAALLTVSVVNQAAVAGVAWLDQGGPLRRVLQETGAGAWLGWLLVGVNLAFGVLFAATVCWLPLATPLLLVPLALLHWASRAYADLRVDRARLDGMQRATHALAGPMDPREAVPDFLVEMRRCFESERSPSWWWSWTGAVWCTAAATSRRATSSGSRRPARRPWRPR